MERWFGFGDIIFFCIVFFGDDLILGLVGGVVLLVSVLLDILLLDLLCEFVDEVDRGWRFGVL